MLAVFSDALLCVMQARETGLDFLFKIPDVSGLGRFVIFLFSNSILYVLVSQRQTGTMVNNLHHPIVTKVNTFFEI